MTVEANFTPKELSQEIPFTIVTGKNESYFLYSKINNLEFIFEITYLDGLIKLKTNPFQESDEIVMERLLGLSGDWLESKSQGFEGTIDFEVQDQPGYGPDDIFVENKPFSLSQIVDLINNEDIELTPDFQRNFIWDRTRQSKLIESILLGLPLPSIYLSQYEDGRLTVVDGLQRLSTIKRFMDNELVLSNLEYLDNCNNRRFDQLGDVLSPLRLRRFGQTQIMCFVIDYRSPSKLKFDLFRRLNTGGKPLNNQEIRNCLSRPHVQEVLKKLVELESFALATDFSVNDTRMEAREAALRFIYFLYQYKPNDPLGAYSGNMEYTLDNFIDEINKWNHIKLESVISIYDNALKTAYHVFGKYCFRKVLPHTIGGRRTPVNKLLMLSFTILLSKFDYGKVIRYKEFGSLTFALAELIDSNEELFRAITWSTNSKWNIETALEIFNDFLNENLVNTY